MNFLSKLIIFTNILIWLLTSTSALAQNPYDLSCLNTEENAGMEAEAKPILDKFDWHAAEVEYSGYFEKQMKALKDLQECESDHDLLSDIISLGTKCDSEYRDYNYLVNTGNALQEHIKDLKEISRSQLLFIRQKYRLCN